MVQKSAVYIAIIGVLAVCLLAAVGVLFYQAAGNSLDIAGLFNPAATIAPISAAVTFSVLEPVPSLTLPPSSIEPIVETSTPNAIQTATKSVQTCGMSGTMTLLIIGRDDFYWESPYGADAIRLIRLDFSQRKAVVFAFPRDLIVKTEMLKEPYGIESSRLGKVYLAVLEHEKGTDLQDQIAADTIAQVLYDDFSIRTDSYMTLKEDVLGKLINALGGVDVNVPTAYTLGPLVVPAGLQRMDGTTAQLYMRRLNSTEEEWGRFNRQNQVFDGLRNELAQPNVLEQVPTLYKQFQGSLVTDLSPSQVIALSCVASQIPKENITFDEIRRDMVTVNPNGSITINDMNQVRQLLNRLGY